MELYQAVWHSKVHLGLTMSIFRIQVAELLRILAVARLLLSSCK